jgi:tetratricopeptide (TPR) repeat protein
MLMDMNKQERLALFFLLTVSISVYLNSLYGGFLLDDEMLIQDAAVIRSFDMDLITYRLVRTLSYAIDYFFWGLNPVGYHISNIIYNAFTVLMVFFVTKRLTGVLVVAFITALLFALHPIHTESVSYLSGRRDILSTLFYLGGFLAYLRARENRGIGNYVVVVACYFAAITSKEMGITLPAMIFAYEVLQTAGGHHDPSRFGSVIIFRALWENIKRFRITIFLVALLVGTYLYLTIFVHNASRLVSFDSISWWGGSPAANFATVFSVLLTYVKIIFFPIVLRFDYHQFPYAFSFFEARVILSLFIVCSLLAASIVLIKRNRLLTFSIWWFFIALLPVLHIIPHHILMAEHYLFLPSYGFCLAGGILFQKIYTTDKTKFVAIVAMVTVLTFYAYRTVARNMDWTDYPSLTKEALIHDPDNPIAHFFLGRDYLDKDLLQSASVHLQRAEGPRYRNANVFAYRALLAFRLGNYAFGVSQTHKALRHDPDHDMARFNLGLYTMKMGNRESALEHFDRVHPGFREGEALIYRAFALVKLMRFEEAESVLLEAENLQPNRVDVAALLGEVYMKTGRLNSANRNYEKVLALLKTTVHETRSQVFKIEPARLRGNIEMIRALRGANDQRERDFSGTESLQKSGSLGELYFMTQNYDSARIELLADLSSLEEKGDAYLMLGKVSFFLDDIDGADVYFSKILESDRSKTAHLFDTGQFYVRTLKLDRAEKAYRKMLKRNSNNGPADKALQQIQQLRTMIQRAEFLESSGNESESMLMMGDIYNAVGDRMRAKESWECVLEKSPNHPGALSRIAQLYETLGYPYLSQTIDAYRRLILLNPADADVYRRLGDIYYHAVRDKENGAYFYGEFNKRAPMKSNVFSDPGTNSRLSRQ